MHLSALALPHEPPRPDLQSLLDETAHALDRVGLPPQLFETLARLRNETPGDWRDWVAICRAHRLAQMLRTDPLTLRAVTRPRGYQGDADMMDLVYTRDPHRLGDEDVSHIGRHTFERMIGGDAAQAVRMRKRALATLIDEVCMSRPGSRVLSIACGHLREAEDAESVLARRFDRFVALDHDPLTIARVRAEKASLGIEAVVGSVNTVLRGRITGPFTLVYSAGLYDYLDAPVAKRLTAKLFDLLEPGGRLVIANFMPGLLDAAFMEAFMDWWLVYRDVTAMAALAAEIPVAAIGARRVLQNENGTVAYLDLERAR